MSDVLENNDLNYPWEEKYPRLGWRGSPTRYNKKYLHITFEEIPRAKLGKVSLDNPEIIDAALTRIPEGLENVTDVLNPKTRLANRIPMEDFMKKKVRGIMVLILGFFFIVTEIKILNDEVYV